MGTTLVFPIIFPHYEADFIMSKFMHGHVVSISSKMGVKADLELLEGVDEVWAMCFRKPLLVIES